MRREGQERSTAVGKRSRARACDNAGVRAESIGGQPSRGLTSLKSETQSSLTETPVAICTWVGDESMVGTVGERLAEQERQYRAGGPYSGGLRSAEGEVACEPSSLALISPRF